MEVRSINTEELIKYQDNPEDLIVDVREKNEIDQTGILPGAIHIPLNEVSNALDESEEEFQTLYGKKKPEKETAIAFSCRSGKRSTMATKIALKLGYLNSVSYSGGWLAWEEHMKENSN